MTRFVLDFERIDRTQVGLAGGKGANLGELARIDGVTVPDGFCVTTDAFHRFMENALPDGTLLERLAGVDPDDLGTIRTRSRELRQVLEEAAIPDDVTAAIQGSLSRFGAGTAWAVRSSATAEDSATASFAGQQDTYLNVVGTGKILEHIRRCWASLFTERAVTYRLQHGLDHRDAQMGVVVQQMIFPQAAGIMFTADPVSGDRRVVSVEASWGLGEALVSGLVNADVFRVRDGAIISRDIGAKHIAIHPAPAGGTTQQEISPEQQRQPALTDSQVLRIAEIGRRVEGHFGQPQDIEWCLADDRFQIVQSRPITTLFPVPETDDHARHVYISVGHQQMMTDAMKPLGISFWQMTTPRPMAVAGGRLFVDVAGILASPAWREDFLEMVQRSDPLIGDALQSIIDRGDFIEDIPDDAAGPPPVAPGGEIATDPAIVTGLIERNRASVARLSREIQGKSGTAMLDFVKEDLQELRRLLFDPQGHQVVMAGMEATWWLNDKLQEWLGEQQAADTLSQSVSNNITAEMGLALLDVADAIRPFPDVIAFLQHGQHMDVLDELAHLEGGSEAVAAIRGWLDSYGMRGPGEIDITRPRWSEQPELLVLLILGHIRNTEPGEASRRFQQGLREAAEKERDVLERLRALPDGERKARETKQMIDRVRTFAGYREYPKYGMICRYFVYKQALLEEAGRLVRAGIFQHPDDLFFLSFQEFEAVVRDRQVDDQLIRLRREAFHAYQGLTPPRVFTSDGEIVRGAYRRDDLPDGALTGLPVSAGVIEGRARVILDVADANLDAGDILVTVCTDPGWTPLFAGISGLVTEVGGLMTHGAVIAREYGLPAVVGVEQATRLIRDRQRIRVDGTNGYVEVLA